jgi:uncharacterized protein YfaS (alpha-2-macroglobulin family)
LTSGDWVLVRLRVRTSERSVDVPDALVVDLLPAGLELDNPQLVTATRFDDVVVAGRPVHQWQEQTRIAIRNSAMTATWRPWPWTAISRPNSSTWRGR